MDRTPRTGPARSARRDEDVRAVSRTTKAVVAVAVLGVGAFAGLAATGQTSAASAVGGKAAATGGGSAPSAVDQGAAPSAGDGWGEQEAPSYDGGYPDDGVVVPQGDLSAPQSVPSFSPQPPVVGSGGS